MFRLDTENSRIYSTETLYEQNFMIAKYDKERLPSSQQERTLLSRIPHTIRTSSNVHSKIHDALNIIL